MNYQTFCKEFKQGVLANKTWGITEENYLFYPDGCTADGDPKKLEFIRNTNAKYKGIQSDVLIGDYAVLRIVFCEEEEVECRYALRDLYQAFKAHGWSEVWKILDGHMKMLTSFRSDVYAKSLDSYEEVKEQLMIRPINYTDNKYLLKDHIYKVYGDIALVVYLVFYDDERGIGGAKLPKNQLAAWKKEEEEVFQQAFANTAAKALPRVYQIPWIDMNTPEDEGDFMSEDGDVKHLVASFLPTVTTTKKINGAIAMFYPGVKEKLAELLGGSFYTAFTSIHEARIHRVGSMPLECILGALQDINSSFPKEELLSRNVFLYDAEKKTFELVSEQ